MTDERRETNLQGTTALAGSGNTLNMPRSAHLNQQSGCDNRLNTARHGKVKGLDRMGPLNEKTETR